MMATSPQGGTGSRQGGPPAPVDLPDRYCLLGVDFTLRTDSDRVRDFFRAAYRRFRVPEGGPGRHPLALTAIMDPEAGGPFVEVDGETLDLSGRPMPENRAFLHLLNAMMDRVSDYVVIHAAAVSVNGKGLLLAGPSTAGKSTLVLELGRKGAAFLSDDVAPIHRRTALLHAFPRALGIRREAGAALAFDPAKIPAGQAHALPHKWLIDPEALALRLPDEGDAPCPVEAVVFLDVAGHIRGAGGRPEQRRRLEIAMVEADREALDELSGIVGISDVHVVSADPFPVISFRADRTARPMHALADFCRERRDIVLYMDEARPAGPDRPETPVLTEARWSALLMDLTRDLLNRSENGAMLASLGGLPALVTELGSLLRGARAYRLRPGNPMDTADLILSLAEG